MENTKNLFALEKECAPGWISSVSFVVDLHDVGMLFLLTSIKSVCDLSKKNFFSGKPPLRYRAEKRRGHGIAGKFRGPASSQLYISEGVYRKKEKNR